MTSSLFFHNEFHNEFDKAVRRDALPRNHNLCPSLQQLGWGPFFSEQLNTIDASLVFGRVCVARREFYQVLTTQGPVNARLGGRLRYRAVSPLDLPTVGDWVVVRQTSKSVRNCIAGNLRDDSYAYQTCSAPSSLAATRWKFREIREKGSPNVLAQQSTSSSSAVVVHRFARKSQLVRKAPGKRAQVQILGANIDLVAIVTTPERDFSPQRLQRYLQAVATSGAIPVFVLNKIDKCVDCKPFETALMQLNSLAPRLLTQATTGYGIDQFDALIQTGQTIIFVGSSGVGKSTLINSLLQTNAQRVESTPPPNENKHKGRHTTTHRELFMLPGNGMLIDTPGLRELQVWQQPDSNETFRDIEELSQHCHFRNCSHNQEPGCAVRSAVQQRRLSEARLHNYLKLHQESQMLSQRKLKE